MSEETKPVEETTAIVKDAGSKVAVKEEKRSIITLLEGESFKNRIAKVLPKHLTPDRMAFVAVACVRKNPKLAQCTQESFFNCMMTLSALGLEPDGIKAHLIPYGSECSLIVDYKGFVDIAYRSGEVAMIHADIVCENDIFNYEEGEVKAHKIDFRKPRGEMYAVYCTVTMKDGTKKSEAMSKADVDGIRKRSRSGANGPWVTDFSEMAKKTVFRRCFKWLHVSSEIKQAIVDDDKFDGITINTKRVEKGSASDCFGVEEEPAKD